MYRNMSPIIHSGYYFKNKLFHHFPRTFSDRKIDMNIVPRNDGGVKQLGADVVVDGGR